MTNPPASKVQQSCNAATGSADADHLMNEVQTSDMLCVSTRTLQGWRLRGCGPVFVKTGRSVRYRRRDLIAWMDANTVQSTSQYN